MDFHFLVMEKSWKINVDKEGAPCDLYSGQMKVELTSLRNNRVSVRHRLYPLIYS